MALRDIASLSKSGRIVWRVARPVLIAYLVIVLVMMLLERRLVYPIPPVAAGNWNQTGFKHEDIWFDSADGTKLHGWFVPNDRPGPALLYCHGNGEDVAADGELAAMLSEKLHASVFVFDYRGYGHSDGSPAEAGCIADGSAAQHWLAKRMRIQPKDVMLMGRSLGGGVAVALAAEHGASALILENTFPRMMDVAAAQYPWLPVRWVMENRYDSLSRIQRYHGPLFQSHGTLDEVVPISFAHRLFEAAPSQPKKWHEYPGLSHNSAEPESYYDELEAFLSANVSSLGFSAPP